MNRLRAATILAFCLAPVSAFAAETFRTEFSLRGASFEDDSQTKSSQAVAAASVYFQALPLNPDYPLAETQFVERVGGIELRLGRGSYEDRDFERTSGMADTSAAIGLSHKQTPLTAFLAVQKVDFGQLKLRDGFGQVDIEMKISQIELGYFVQPRLHVSVARELATTRSAFVPASRTIPDFEVETWSLAGRYLGESSAGHFALDGYAASVDKDYGRMKNREFALGGRNYLDRNQHIGLRVGLNIGDDRSDEGQWLRLSYGNFLTPTIEIFGSFEKFLTAEKAQGSDADAWSLGVSTRF